MIEEEEFRSIISVAQRILDVYGRPETSDPSLISHRQGEMMISSQRGVIDIFFRGSLVFRHDPQGKLTDFFEVDDIWIDEMARMAENIPPSSGLASQRS